MTIKYSLSLLFLITAKSHAGWFDDGQSYIDSCINLYKKQHNIELHVKAENVIEIKNYKYEYTPVIVARGQETVLTRQYCEYYPEEKMIYTGIAESVIAKRRQEESERLQRQLIIEQNEYEQKSIERKHQAELNALKENARADQAAKELIRKAELAKIATEAKKSADKKARIAQLEVERLKAAERVTKEKERKEKKNEKERILAEFTPLLPQCVKNDYSRLKNKLNVDSPNFNGDLVPKEQKLESFNIAGEFLIVNYTYYSYDQKKHDRWKKQNGPTAGQLFKGKTKATCLISELKNNL